MYKRKKLKPEQMAVNVSGETRRRIEEEAQWEGISISSWIGRAIERYFEWESNSEKDPTKGETQDNERTLL